MLRGRGLRVKFNKYRHYCFELVWFKLMSLLFPGPVKNINRFERQVFSQNGEDGLIEHIFDRIGETNKYFVEIGAGDGIENNTRYLKDKGWTGLQIDGQKSEGIKKYFVTAENVENILRKNRVPEKFDFLSIDIDGMDYWVWKAISHFQPRVVVIEYNASIPLYKNLTVGYNPKFIWDGTTFFGASLGALSKLAEAKGYHLVATNLNGVNAFFVKKILAKKILATEVPLSLLYHPPSFRIQTDGSWGGHPHSSKMSQMVSDKHFDMMYIND